MCLGKTSENETFVFNNILMHGVRELAHVFFEVLVSAYFVLLFLFLFCFYSHFAFSLF